MQSRLIGFSYPYANAKRVGVVSHITLVENLRPIYSYSQNGMKLAVL